MRRQEAGSGHLVGDEDLFYSYDCKDAGASAMQEQLPQRIKSLRHVCSLTALSRFNAHRAR